MRNGIALFMLFVVVVVVLVVVVLEKDMKSRKLCARMTTPISEAVLKNDVTYVLGTKRVGFVKGEGYNLDNMHAPNVAVISQITYGDYDHDGWTDAAVLITETNGTTWLAIVRNVEGTPNLRKAIQLDFPADGIEFDANSTIRVIESHRYGRRSVAYGYTEPYLWKSIE